ncbi:MAG TPA: hypothetical protein VH394_12480 [Thermoanaerobaculia bacterium]|jgi:hypothetical protein|nr:hypothetical protein [Thermoanaerobaculia bacterium]
MRELLAAFRWQDADWVGVALTGIGLIGAIIAFILGLLQYRRAQLWKRKEFVAEEMKYFFADLRVRNALLLIDWGVRRLDLSLRSELPPEQWPVVTRSEQISALRPHTLLGDDDEAASDVEATSEVAASGILKFSPLEVYIRDTFDVLLDYFERFAGFADARLVGVEDLRPYLSYWIHDIASVKGPPEDIRWTLALFTYINVYGFSGTVALFKLFGYDIRVGGARWEQLVALQPDWEMIPQLEASFSKMMSDQGADQTANHEPDPETLRSTPAAPLGRIDGG